LHRLFYCFFVVYQNNANDAKILFFNKKKQKYLQFFYESDFCDSGILFILQEIHNQSENGTQLYKLYQK